MEGEKWELGVCRHKGREGSMPQVMKDLQTMFRSLDFLLKAMKSSNLETDGERQ